jgi:hypothetical protein
MKEEHGAMRSEAELVEDAISRVHRGFVGLVPDEGGPHQSTGPFRKWASDRRAEVLLRQVDAKTFRLAQPFRYRKGVTKFDVPEDDVTDLASVPRFLVWLVPRYGRHTLAALLHDHLQDDDSVTPEQADAMFRDSMGETGVPLSRRWMMWAAVALRTQWKMGGLHLVRALLWALIFGLAGLGLWPIVTVVLVFNFGWAAVSFSAVAFGAAVVLPVSLCWLWASHWRVGAVAGIALMFFAVQVVLIVVALVAYLAVEWLLERALVRPAHRNPVLTRNL